jgi:pimeloyl-ACP methyl ester carboxylesterase
VTNIPTTMYAHTVEGGYLAYQVSGTGPTDLVLPMNGGYPIDLMWEVPVIALGLSRLASFSRLITFDPRGFGSSSGVDPEHVPAVQSWMDDVGTVMDAVGSDKANFLSWGEYTPAVMLFAATYPQRITNLVLVNAYGRFLRSSECPWGMPPDRHPPMSRPSKRHGEPERLPRHRRQAWSKTTKRDCVGPDPNASRLPRIASPFPVPSWKAMSPMWCTQYRRRPCSSVDEVIGMFDLNTVASSPPGSPAPRGRYGRGRASSPVRRPRTGDPVWVGDSRPTSESRHRHSCRTPYRRDSERGRRCQWH